MTVKELIEKLQKFDGEMIVIFPGQDDDYEPAPKEEKFEFDHSYYDGDNFHSIPMNTPFVSL